MHNLQNLAQQMTIQKTEAYTYILPWSRLIVNLLGSHSETFSRVICLTDVAKTPAPNSFSFEEEIRKKITQAMAYAETKWFG